MNAYLEHRRCYFDILVIFLMDLVMSYHSQHLFIFYSNSRSYFEILNHFFKSYKNWIKINFVERVNFFFFKMDADFNSFVFIRIGSTHEGSLSCSNTALIIDIR